MSCEDFFSGDLNQVIESKANEDWVPVVFVHVPKTGGTSAQRDLNFVFPESVHISSSNKDADWKQLMDRFVDDPPRLLRGHLNAEDIQVLSRTTQPFRTVTYLRDPLRQTISQFLWSRANFRGDPERYKDPGGFEAFFERRMENYSTNWLLGPVESPDEAVAKICREFWFVGISEFYHVCQCVLFESFGAHYRIRKRHNRTEPHPDDVAETKSIDMSSLSEQMQTDLATYHYFRDRWTRILNDAVELLMRPIQQQQQKRFT